MFNLKIKMRMFDWSQVMTNTVTIINFCFYLTKSGRSLKQYYTDIYENK